MVKEEAFFLNLGLISECINRSKNLLPGNLQAFGIKLQVRVWQKTE